MTVHQYLSTEETNRHRELVFGVVREPPSPFPYHQAAVVRLVTRLQQHVDETRAGKLYVSPLDVILDEARHLVLQPDILFISTANEAIVRDWVRGAPDLVIEVLSPGTRGRDRKAKRGWYLHYGVKEYWLVDPRDRTIEVVAGPSGESVTYAGGDQLRSAVLPDLRMTPVDLV